MINKKNVLGKTPYELGLKDAVHVGIVAVRAGQPIAPGQRCTLNEYREAIPSESGEGVADPFGGRISTGQAFWLLMCQDQLPNVQHVWDHPTMDFSPPSRETVKNRYLVDYAEGLGVTYEQLLAACAYVVENEEPAAYPGTKTGEEFEKALNGVDDYDLWYEWSNESGYEFENDGTECCPEYRYPEESLFSSPQ